MSGHERSPHSASPPHSRAQAPYSPVQSAAKAVVPAELLARLWRQNLPLLRDRLACLQGAADEALSGTLSDARKTEAVDLAHKLAGSLGMFGYPAGTEIARAMEQHLETAAPVDAAYFARLVADLHAVLPLE